MIMRQNQGKIYVKYIYQMHLYYIKTLTTYQNFIFVMAQYILEIVTYYDLGT